MRCFLRARNIDHVIFTRHLSALISDFYRVECGTRLRVLREIFGGAWDALATERADIAIGAPGDSPPGSGCATHLLGLLEFAFAVAPSHPIPTAPEPLKAADIQAHRVVVAADGSVPTKLAVQIAGLGVGYLPKRMAQPAIAADRLVLKRVEEPKPPVPLFIAWRARHKGKALQWFVERLRANDTAWFVQPSDDTISAPKDSPRTSRL
jgi:DNA-binding transcriptional LysR family regulator